MILFYSGTESYNLVAVHLKIYPHKLKEKDWSRINK